MKAAILVRVSTEKQDYNRQIFELTGIAKSKGYKDKDVETFGEIISGYKNKEADTKLTELLNKVEANPLYFNLILISEISRIGRNPKEIRATIERLAELKIPVYIQSLGIQTLDENGKMNFATSILIMILSEVANMEAETFKTRSRSGLLEKARMGRAGGSNNFPYGYTKDGIKGMLIIEPSEAITINRIFGYYEKGFGDKMIANILNMEKIPTRKNKTHAGKNVKFGGIVKDGAKIKWCDKTIADIIRNTIYKGDRRFKGHILNAPVIINAKLWDKCNEIRQSKTHTNYLTEYVYLLKDKIKCGVCGRNMFAKYKPVEGGDKVYICSSRLTKGGGCGNTGINIEFIESVIFQEITQVPLPACIGNKAEHKISLKHHIERLEMELKIEAKNIKDKTKEREKAVDLCLSEIITKADLIDRQKKYDNIIQTAERKIRSIKSELKIKQEALKYQDSDSYNEEQMNKIKADRLQMAGVIKQVVHKVIVTKVNHSEFLVAFFMTAVGEKPSKFYFSKPIHLLLDKTALRSRYGGDLKYTREQPDKTKPAYDGDVLITDAEQHAKEMKRTAQYIIPELIKIAS